jgi:hypothetical protein
VPEGAFVLPNKAEACQVWFGVEVNDPTFSNQLQTLINLLQKKLLGLAQHCLIKF